MEETSHSPGVFFLFFFFPAIDYNSDLAVPGILAFKKSSKMAEG